MTQNKYRELVRIKNGKAISFRAGAAHGLLCSDMGGRIFGECCGLNLHRIDLECAEHPSSSFNNYGGNTFWPAPEGGRFGFNYRGNDWFVQPAINEQPFQVIRFDATSALIGKDTKLVNRTGAELDVQMRREFNLLSEPHAALKDLPLRGFFSYATVDSFMVRNSIPQERALIASWTLEQFDATDGTISFCAVAAPEAAINFDYYEHPGDYISYYQKGFTYRTNARRKGQIGVRASAGALFIGFIDRSRGLICVRENLGPKGGVHFNMADNEQKDGPYSAADNYSIFNSDQTMKAFELETVGAMQTRDNLVLGSELISTTCLAVLPDETQCDGFISRHLGKKV